MKIYTLLENTRVSNSYINKHGLSLYIETKKHKILFDTGPDDSFIKNAHQLGVDLSEVDLLIISHGHYDHGGGLKAFLTINNKAKILLSKYAFDKYYVKILGLFKYYVGLDIGISDCDRIKLIEDSVSIDDEVLLFGNITSDKLMPTGNKKLLTLRDGQYTKDDFAHEINLLLKEDGKLTLFCGCSHKGVINIVDKAKSIVEKGIDTVVGGMHLYDLKPNKPKDQKYLDELVLAINKSNVTMYYTCHCTGVQVYEYLKKQSENEISYLKTGMIIDI